MIKSTETNLLDDYWYFNKSSANLFVYMLSSLLPIGQQNKPWLTNYNCYADYTKLEGLFGLNGHLYFYTSIKDAQSR